VHIPQIFCILKLIYLALVNINFVEENISVSLCVRATAGGAAVGDDAQASATSRGSKVSLLLMGKLHTATYLAGDPKRKE
jgi:hypothetical protein